MMNYTAEVIADSTGKWCGNELVFATREQAIAYAADLASRWFAVSATRVVETDKPATYTWDATRSPRLQRIPDAPIESETPTVDASRSICTAGPLAPRALHVIAREISREWPRVYFAAVPYLKAMATLNRITDNYGVDDARSIVLYFLVNARGWRGDAARRIKAELKTLAGVK